MNKHNVLIIGDTHEFATLTMYLDFCKEVQKKYQCGVVVHIGDIVDNHSISYHEHNPNGMSPKEEYEKTLKKVQQWFKAFPHVYHCLGNHDTMVDRKAKTVGLPESVFKPFREIWQLPAGWISDFVHVIDGVKYTHAPNHGGRFGHLMSAVYSRMSYVCGHCHSIAGVDWHANDLDRVFGMAVGCGIDRKSYAFDYGRDFKYKPVISCGVVLENGKMPLVIPMELGSKIKVL